MRILGLSGLFGTEHDDYPPDVSPKFFHDAAAALVVDGVVLAAAEEERFNREKHTNRFPLGATGACLDEAGIGLDEIDAVAYFFDEDFTDRELRLECLNNPRLAFRGSRDLIRERLEKAFGGSLDTERIHFVRHHLTHAEAAYCDSGQAEALVAVVDGNGECEGVSFYAGRPTELTHLVSFPRSDSLGHFYTALTRFTGYYPFDEYKVMGLAPYGDHQRFLPLLSRLCSLGEAGSYTLDVAGLPALLLDAGLTPRRAGDAFDQVYADLAAAGQRLLEDVMFHLLRYWQRATGLTALAVAGGVGQNTSLNGRLLREGPFTDVYVHPASHDGGSALGAAYAVDRKLRRAPRTRTRLPHVYLGPALGDRTVLTAELERWSSFVTWEEPRDIAARAAGLLVGGEVIGWAQGRSEYGPRALGNRSILADPRPPGNKDRVNSLIKFREAYRPLAPAVLDTRAAEFFELPPTGADHSYMGFVVDVRADRRDALGAVTHVDGTARVQIVRQEQNPLYWRLIEAFGELTGVPVVLNTSFNNNAEPMVQDSRDVLRTLLSTGLSTVVLGPFLVSGRQREPSALLELALSLSPFCMVSSRHDARGNRTVLCRRNAPEHAQAVSESTAALVRRATTVACVPVRDLLTEDDNPDHVAAELRALWERRLIDLSPVL
ncbi:carbamoyltransferase family protein [Streptomyces sp. SS8]